MKYWKIGCSWFLGLVITSCTNSALEVQGNRFLTINTVIRVNQIEVTRDKNVGVDEREWHTPERVVQFRNAVEKGFPGAKDWLYPLRCKSRGARIRVYTQLDTIWRDKSKTDSSARWTCLCRSANRYTKRGDLLLLSGGIWLNINMKRVSTLLMVWIAYISYTNAYNKPSESVWKCAF